MTELPDISHLTVAELIELRANADELITTKKETGIAQMRARFEEEAASFGLTAAIVVNGAPKKVRKSRVPKEE
jgi:hypothetical protein